MRWWACDNGHSHPLHTRATMPIRLWCNDCTPPELYRVEPTVNEDDPTRLVPPPGKFTQQKTTKETNQ